MRNLILFIILFTCFGTYAFAQTAGNILGRITSKNEKAVEGVSVALLRAKDSVTLKLAVADKAGLFAFKGIANGRYLVLVTGVGHKKAYSPTFEVIPEKQNVQLATINLVPIQKAMSDVTVTTVRPLVEQRMDRTVVNVDASVTNAGTTALEVLEKSPGVTVDRDGNISLKGKEGVMVLIDGRPTQLGGADLANLLRNMNSSQLDQVEIMTNPPARYDAAGNAGIINIKTKKNKTAGYNGSVNANYIQGKYPKTNQGFNFNYRNGKVNVFTNVNTGWAKNFETLTIQRSLQNNNNNVIDNYFDQRANMIRVSNSFNGKVGMDYFANKKQQ